MLYLQVEDIDTKLDLLIEMYKEDRRVMRETQIAEKSPRTPTSPRKHNKCLGGSFVNNLKLRSILVEKQPSEPNTPVVRPDRPMHRNLSDLGPRIKKRVTYKYCTEDDRNTPSRTPPPILKRPQKEYYAYENLVDERSPSYTNTSNSRCIHSPQSNELMYHNQMVHICMPTDGDTCGHTNNAITEEDDVTENSLSGTNVCSPDKIFRFDDAVQESSVSDSCSSVNNESIPLISAPSGDSSPPVVSVNRDDIGQNAQTGDYTDIPQVLTSSH